MHWGRCHAVTDEVEKKNSLFNLLSQPRLTAPPFLKGEAEAGTFKSRSNKNVRRNYQL